MSQTRNRRAGVEDRWTKTVRDEHGNEQRVPSAAHGKGMRWRARYVDAEGRERSKAFRVKAHAQAWLDEIVAGQVTGSYVDPRLGKVTFMSFYNDWSTRQVWVSGTRHAMDQAVNSVTFGTVALADLRPSHLEAWIKELQENQLQASTIKTRFANVRTIIRAAIRDRHLTRDPSENVRLPRRRKASAAMVIPTVAEVGATLHAATEWMPALVALCSSAGLRRGEVSALQVGDIDFLRKEIHVERQVQWPEDGTIEIRPPKYGSERTVYAPDELLAIVAEHIRLYCAGDDPKRWLFPGTMDRTRPVHAATVGRKWRALRASVDVGYRLHDLRHFYASGLIAAGCDVVTVQRALGHASAAMTLEVYGHLWPDASDRTRKAAGDLLAAALDSPADALRTAGAKTPSD
ncbi:tyrosine-type recombinase/integrase [Mycolicibacterium goodii]|uniref:Site-specific integrase n=1 Tax=Mycolicibacterium goodii TaxID=134601 RepID=A0ABS6HP56_MYCGD|nr:tyrosine-type recombinase/integrase [Mycolicibacterium goodii]MBU8824406.1 site-specific integrase [Mycolicibacterium goodii]MBU8838421.1 site-specific integrase [Mycolicibacterium goodii]